MEKNQTSSGISFATVLFVVFLVLKLTGHINWSWWWVTCPLWIGLAICLAFFLVYGLILLVARRIK